MKWGGTDSVPDALSGFVQGSFCWSALSTDGTSCAILEDIRVSIETQHFTRADLLPHSEVLVHEALVASPGPKAKWVGETE